MAEDDTADNAAGGSTEPSMRELCEAFQRQWSSKQPLVFREFLERAKPADRPQLLRKLLRLDIELRETAGLKVRASDYSEFGAEAANFARDLLAVDPLTSTQTAAIRFCEQCGTPVTVDGTENEVCSVCGQPSLFSSPANEDDFEVVPALQSEARFTILGLIGEGAFGVVYKARDNKLQRTVALKMPKKSLTGKTLLAREARAASKLRHIGIVRIFDVVETDEQVFVVSDFIDGQTLSKYRLAHKVNEQKACEISLQLADAMQHAHALGVIHRDLKPSNIVMDNDGQAYVLDFGLSRSRMDSEGTVLRPGSPIGTPAYMPPEQATGSVDQIGTESDVYALGVIFYQLLTGHLPFSGDFEDILHDILHTQPVSTRVYNKAIPQALDAIVMKALAKNPADRYKTAGKLAEDIRNFKEDRRVVAYPKTDQRVVKRWVRTGVLPVSVLLLLGVVGAILYFWRAEVDRNNPLVAVTQGGSPEIEMLHWLRWNEDTGLFNTEGETVKLGDPLSLPPGYYRVRVDLKSGGHWGVYRTVPRLQEPPLVRPGIPMNHLYWDSDDNRTVKLPDIKVVPAVPDADAIPISGGAVELNETDGQVSPFVKGRVIKVDAGKISVREVDLQEVNRVFPNAKLTAIDADVALAYCEAVGAELLTIGDYAMIYRQEIRVPTITTGLPEWTATPRPAVRIEFGGKVVSEIESNRDEMLLLHAANPAKPSESMKPDTPVISPFAIAPDGRMGVPSEPMGFRLKWE